MKALIFITVIVLASGCSGLEKNKADLESAYVGRGSKLNLLAAPNPEFEEPTSYTSVYLIKCPGCKETQFLMPDLIQATGSISTTNGTIQTRVLHFDCKTRRCREDIMLTDQIFVPPIKSIRVR